MPNKHSAKKGFPCKPGDCKWVSRHLEPHLFKMYSIMMGFAEKGRKSRGGETLMCTASVRPTLANAFNCSVNNAEAHIATLVERGWVIKHVTGRDPKTGHNKPHHYEMVIHKRFVQKHPSSCPPWVYAPTRELADEYGVSYGDRIDLEDVPENFQQTWQTPLGNAISEWLSHFQATATEDDRAALIEHYKNLKFVPEDPEEREQRLKQNRAARLAIEADRAAGITVPSGVEPDRPQYTR
jgi:hypothetical protein